MKPYDHSRIEKKWQKAWSRSKIYKTKDNARSPKFYALDMFPYPSGEGLHVGHPKGYIATDIVSRMKRMQGHNVLHPMGFDAFGLPAENYAIATKTNPQHAVKKNVARYKKQLEILGFDYDWSREVNTTDPNYYRWTQWIFLQLYKKGLAYESYEPIDWCPKDKTGLAKEDIEDGKCERCGTPVEKKLLRQWVLKITDYAERLLMDIDDLEWPESIKESQRNWIGKSEGAEIDFPISISGKNTQERITVFTTRADTLLGVTYVVLAPEHPLIEKLIKNISNATEVAAYVESARIKTEIERTDAKKQKTGVELKGIQAIHPVTNEALPVWLADYVLADYGTGAVMAVPAHDERDHAFALVYKLPIKEIELGNKAELTKKYGTAVTKYKLRDWVFARQRYWGEPIPMIHCEKCGTVPVPEKDLPVKLPKVKYYEPTGTGESPLAAIKSWVNVRCPVCKGKAKRETNTMPQWAGSSWYYLRFVDPKNKKALIHPTKESYWSPVDLYVGGAEHATRHLVYARFWHKFLYDIGVVSQKEPFKKLYSVGLIMAEDGRKMSKRYGNVVNPDEIVGLYGADTMRLYEMFMGPFDQAIAWSTTNMIGVRRFIERVWKLQSRVTKNVSEKDLAQQEKIIHKAIQKVSEDIVSMRHNTAISALMIALNDLETHEHIATLVYEQFLLLLAPYAPHVSEELWSIQKHKTSIHLSQWPTFDPQKVIENTVTIVVQINGKVRAELTVPRETSEADIKAQAQQLPEVEKWTKGKNIAKVIFVAGKLVNIVVT